MSARDLCVVKLGGSHALRPHLRDWLEALAACAGKVAVVPGGGPFADAVRAAQPVMGFDDAAAHHMALCAMEQFGVAIVGMGTGFVTASSLIDIRRAAAIGKVPVWLPVRMALASPDLPQTWDLTADSLAAWLAARLRVQRIVMIKHSGTDGRAGDVDPLFESYRAAGCIECIFLSPTDTDRLGPTVRRQESRRHREQKPVPDDVAVEGGARWALKSGSAVHR